MNNLHEEIINEWLKDYWHLILKYELNHKIRFGDYVFYLNPKDGFYLLYDDNKITLELMNSFSKELLVRLLPEFQKELIIRVGL